jgi:streptogramin lyase
MGIHSGEADLTVDRYVGLSVNRAARICAVGHGGQVLVSGTTASLIQDEEEDLPGIALKDLGEHRLKDISRPVRLYQLEIDGLRTTFPPLAISAPREPNRRKRVALAAAALLVVGATAVALVVVSRDEAPPPVLPNSLVRIDPRTLKPTDVFPIGGAPDITVAAGGYLWVTHHILRDDGSETEVLRDAGDRTLTRVDPSTGEVVVVGGGLAPCGLTADPSGDVWVANCFASGSGANVVRIDAATLDFEATWPVPSRYGYYRGLAYGGGSLWVSPVVADTAPSGQWLTQVDPRTGAQQPIRPAHPTGALAWSEGYGDLWLNHFDLGSLTRMHAATRVMQTVEGVATHPAFPVIDGDVVWVADWAAPRVVRLRADGPSQPRSVALPARNRGAGVWNVATGFGAVWAATPRDGALWRIDPRAADVTRIPIAHLPVWVTAGDDELWLTVRAR